MHIRGIRFLLVMVGSCLLSGCVVLAPFIDAAQNSGATPGSRRQLLVKAVKEFNNALYWGKPGAAFEFVDADGGPSVSAQALKKREGEQLVETNFDNVEYGDRAWSAKVDVTFKYYKIPFYIVTERKLLQEWKYSVVGGWKVTAMEERKS